MSLPPISPTGAMASGEYVDYMISYLGPAMDSESSQLDSYLGESVYIGWDDQWDRQITDLNAMVVDLAKRISKLKSQTMMVKDAISRL